MHGLIHLSFRQAMLEEHWVSDLQMASICLSTGEKEQNYINRILIRNRFTDCNYKSNSSRVIFYEMSKIRTFFNEERLFSKSYILNSSSFYYAIKGLFDTYREYKRRSRLQQSFANIRRPWFSLVKCLRRYISPQRCKVWFRHTDLYKRHWNSPVCWDNLHLLDTVAVVRSVLKQTDKVFVYWSIPNRIKYGHKRVKKNRNRDILITH